MVDDSVMFDCMGKEIFVGDTVLIATAGRSAAHLRKGVVTRIGKRITISQCDYNYEFRMDPSKTAFGTNTHQAIYDKDSYRYFKLE